LDLFQKYVHPAFEAQRLVLVTNQFGDNKVSVYAFGHLKPGKTVKDIAFSSAAVAKGVTDPKTGNVIGVAATQPAPDDGKASAPATEPAEEPEAAPTAAPAAAPAPAPATQPSGE
jgi:pyruvate dehydrogenase E2 component (dihydrolipoamide acetyltransferase)